MVSCRKPFFPARFASYRSLSARLMSSEVSSGGVRKATAPTLRVTGQLLSRIVASTASRTFGRLVVAPSASVSRRGKRRASPPCSLSAATSLPPPQLATPFAVARSGGHHRQVTRLLDPSDEAGSRFIRPPSPMTVSRAEGERIELRRLQLELEAYLLSRRALPSRHPYARSHRHPSRSVSSACSRPAPAQEHR